MPSGHAQEMWTSFVPARRRSVSVVNALRLRTQHLA
jgi:hypothetical protein